MFNLRLSNKELEAYALEIGSDCPFFIDNTPKLVEGIGDQMKDIDLDLEDYEIRLVNPGIHISTKEAYSKVVPRIPKKGVEEYIKSDLSQWKGKLKNDFENFVFEQYPNLKTIKQDLYNEGYIYVSMSGSGSVIFSIR